jgi:MFS family permease
MPMSGVMSHSEGADSEERIDRGTLMALFAMGLAVFAVANDFTALTVALPRIEHQFNADVSTVQWVINAFASGMQSGFRVAAALAAAGFLVAVGFIDGRLRVRPGRRVSEVSAEAT